MANISLVRDFLDLAGSVCSFRCGFAFPLISRSVDVPVAIAHYENTICTLHCVWIEYLRTHEY